MTTSYELPWIAELSQRQVEAQILVGVFTKEMFSQGVEECVGCFLKKFSAMPGVYKVKLTEHFNDDIPAEVAMILSSISEDVSDIQQNLADDYYNDDVSGLGILTTAAKMASIASDVRALDHILGT